MRLHDLRITAFGPFAEEVRVDFDELSESGLFLLTGATGAGKTSILDAVCFALYGQVPGDRAGAKHLRSDHAEAQVAPEVSLRLSVGEREFIFTRSPAWMRPKIRGVGETKVQAHVLVEERVAGEWVVRTNRLDDAGLLVTELLGMSGTQFTQVAMLPQGKFQAFLRASSAERHQVLQQLFRTDRFERMESWMVDRRSHTRRAVEAATDRVVDVLSRFQEASGASLDPAFADDLPRVSESGDLERWVHQVTSAVVLAEAEAIEYARNAALQLQEASDHLARAEKVHELRTRAESAQLVIERWAQRAGEVGMSESRLADHRCAAPLTELARARTAARQTASLAAQSWSARRKTLVGLLGEDVRLDELQEARRRSQETLARLVAFGQRATTHGSATSELRSLRRQLQTVETGIAELELVQRTTPALIADAEAAVNEAQAAASQYPIVLHEIDRLESLVAAARRAELIGLELTAARTDVLTATEFALEARETYLDLREARINGMSGELAAQLASGCSCPVCGSTTHPAPAAATAPGAAGANEDLARKRVDDAEFELQARRVAVASLEGELTSLEERLEGADRLGLSTALAAAHDAAERLEPLVSALEVLVDRASTCRRTLNDAEIELKASLLSRMELQTRVDLLDATTTAIEQEWRALLEHLDADGNPRTVAELPDLIRQQRTQVADLEAAAADFSNVEATAAAADDLSAQLNVAATASGFASDEAALAALLTPEQCAELEELVEQARDETQRAREILEDPPVRMALEQKLPPVDLLRAQQAEAAITDRKAAAAESALTGRRARLEQLGADLADLLAAWRPLYDDYRTVAELASFLEGKSVDNVQRMRLAAYVLAERLRQVVDAANERLVAMTDQRYALEHTDERGFGEQRGGLSLRVRDDWNGVLRDPATLSGGETFVVSLALALGLADTVAHEAGGTDIDTLFIDEGFGSLDADTLEDVMDTLDSLRDGGRVVGLVSHVPELRSRITTQLEVIKGRAGSTVRTATSFG